MSSSSCYPGSLGPVDSWSHQENWNIPNYSDLESSIQCNGIFTEPGASLEDLCSVYLNDYPGNISGTGSDYFNSFLQIPIGEWNGVDCEEWASLVCQRRGLGALDMDLRAFSRVSGAQLKKFQIQHFNAVVGDLQGAVFFEELKALKKILKKKKKCSLLPSPGTDHGPSWSAAGAMDKSMAKEKVKTKSRRGERNPKIWEFLVRLLADPKTNPLLVQWQDEESGTFTLVEPEVIAKLWGARSNKPNLTYNNFARGMRYHYSTGAIEAVPEHKLMYRCGTKALQFLHSLQC